MKSFLEITDPRIRSRICLLGFLNTLRISILLSSSCSIIFSKTITNFRLSLSSRYSASGNRERRRQILFWITSASSYPSWIVSLLSTASLINAYKPSSLFSSIKNLISSSRSFGGMSFLLRKVLKDIWIREKMLILARTLLLENPLSWWEPST